MTDKQVKFIEDIHYYTGDNTSLSFQMFWDGFRIVFFIFLFVLFLTVTEFNGWNITYGIVGILGMLYLFINIFYLIHNNSLDIKKLKDALNIMNKK